jgi:hypothetical protein
MNIITIALTQTDLQTILDALGIAENAYAQQQKKFIKNLVLNRNGSYTKTKEDESLPVSEYFLNHVERFANLNELLNKFLPVD